MSYKTIVIAASDTPKIFTFKDAAQKVDPLCDVYVAETADEARNYIGQHKENVDLVIMDWRLKEGMLSTSATEDGGKLLLEFLKDREIKPVVCSDDAERLAKEDGFEDIPVVSTDSLDKFEERLKEYL